METTENILLGYGTVNINDVPIGLTRGGSSFTVEREVRDIEADGDKGPVKGRIVIDTETSKLTVNALEMFSIEEINKYYPATKITGEELASTLKFNEEDYVSVEWIGKTLAGKEVIIELPVAINLENLELTLEDKNEVVPELTFTGVYLESDRNASTWNINFPQTAGAGE